MFHILLFLMLALPVGEGHKALPLERNVSLSGNYGELRDGRFHAGLDFRVGGVPGEKVYSIDSGYIKSLTVSPSGYGNAVHIAHPDGTTSIYAHLQEFAPELARKVREKQYKEESFSVRLFFDKDEFPVNVHTFIGRVGNTGSSAAPHLHLEIRNSEDTGPINPVAHGYFDIYDTYPPVIHSVSFFSFEQMGTEVKSKLLYTIEQSKSDKSEVVLPECSYISIDADDYQNGTINRLSVERFNVLLDKDTIFRFQLGDYLWKEQDSFLTLVEYVNGKSTLTTRVGPRYGFSNKISSSNGGMILLRDTLVHRLKVEAYDLAGNRTIRRFKIKKGDFANDSLDQSIPDGDFVPWFLPYTYLEDGFSFAISPGTFEYSTRISATIDSTSAIPNALSPVLKLSSNQRLPFFKRAVVKIPISLPDSLRGKAVMAAVAPDSSLHCCGGTIFEGKMVARVGGLGAYCIAIDTIAPSITPEGRYTFIIEDDFSGIASYRAEVDGEWVLAEFDEKNDRLKIVPDPQRVARGRKHQLIITLLDRKGNITKHKQDFRW